MITTVDDWITETADVLQKLTRSRFSVWFTYAAEANFPSYAAFCAKHDWDVSGELRTELDRLWQASFGSLPDGLVTADALDDLANLAPHGDDFDSPESTYAQSVVICVDCALRGLTGSESLSGVWCEYAIEPAVTKASLGMFGATSPSDAERQYWSREIAGARQVASLLVDLSDLAVQLGNPAFAIDRQLLNRAQDRATKL